ncbi:MAG: ABC transporter substrate-binding protein [bacterium]
MKRFLYLFVLVSTLAMLVGPASAKTKVIFWHNYGKDVRDVVEKLIKDHFEPTYPDIEVDLVFVPSGPYAMMNEKIMTAIAGGTPPDAMVFNRPYVSEWAMNKALVNLKDHVVGSGVTSDTFFAFAWNECLYKNDPYALPLNTDDRALYYNRAAFREVGLNPDNPPKTIKELDEYAEKLTKFDASGRLVRIGFVPWYFQGYYLFCWTPTWGGELYDPATKKIVVNDPRNVEIFEWFLQYVNRYNVAVLDSFSKSFGGEASDPFILGLVAMKLDGDWALLNLKRFAPDLDYGVAYIPVPPGGVEKTTYAGGWGIAMPRGAKHLKEAFEFMRFYSGYKAQLEYAKAAYVIPTHREAAKDPFFYEDPKHAIFMELLPNAKGRPTIPVLGMLWDEIKASTDFVRYGKKTPKQALDDTVKKVQPELDKALER